MAHATNCGPSHDRAVYLFTRSHPFPNGNGRHARLMADALVMSLGQPRFTWGQAPLEAAGNARERYLTALRAADVGQWELLNAFVRS